MPKKPFFKRRKRRYTHQIPGLATYIGEKDLETEVEVMTYNSTGYKKMTKEDLFPKKDFQLFEKGVTWVNVRGLNDIKVVKRICDFFELHRLVVEDIVNTGQRPKVEEYEKNIFTVLKILRYDEAHTLRKEHLGIVLGSNYVLTFHESEFNVFGKLKERIELSEGQIRDLGADFLMYSVLDAVIDEYFNVIETIIEKEEHIEDALYEKDIPQNLTLDIQGLKHEIIQFWKSVQALPQYIKLLESSNHDFIQKKTRNYLRDLTDHLLQINENIEVYRAIVWGLMDMYLATLNTKMNEIMKTLTILASIFIPLTFIAGVYGMNFNNMPELGLKYGYFVVLGVMALVTLGMLWYFRRKRWL